MVFAKNVVRLVSLKKVNSSKSDWTGTFVSIADMKTYENLELLLQDEANAKILTEGKDYTAMLHYDGRKASVTLKLPTNKPVE